MTSTSEINTRIARERRELMKLMDEGPYQVAKRQVDENILIATWNIQHFSNRKSPRAIQYIADICERFDIIALQEVKTDLRGLNRLQKQLPGNYKILVSDPTGANERFAFLYDKRTVIPTGLVCEIGFNVSGTSRRGYQLHRMPYCASFRAGRFDFVIASTHIYFGEGARGRQEREKEIRKLVEFIDKRAKTARYKVFDRDFFVLGDFNIKEEGDDFFEALESKGFTLRPEMNNLKTNFLQTSTYDKIVWVDRPESFHFEQCNVVPFGKVLFQEMNPPGGKKEISDHLPLWAEFRVDKLTQQLDNAMRSS